MLAQLGAWMLAWLMLLLAIVEAKQNIPSGVVQKEISLRQNALITEFTGKEITKRAVYFGPRALDRSEGLALLRRTVDNDLPASAPRYEEVYLGMAIYYNLKVGAGSPGQEYNLVLDTTSSDTWIANAAAVKQCSNGDRSEYLENLDASKFCTNSRMFNSSESDSFKSLNEPFNRTFLDETYVSGIYATDNFTLSAKTDGARRNITLGDLQFGLADNTNDLLYFMRSGRLGIGMRDTQGVAQGAETYDDFIASLFKEGYLKSQTVSLWMGDLSDPPEQSPTNMYKKGLALFGGLDRSKFSGKVYLMPFIKTEGDSSVVNPFITLTNLSCHGQYGEKFMSKDGMQLPVLLDTTRFFTYLPYSLIVDFASQLSAVYQEKFGVWAVDCSIKSVSGYMGLFLNGVRFEIPLDDLLYTMYDNETGHAFLFEDGTPACILAFSPSDAQGYSSLGSSVLSSLYIVMDREQSMVGLAQAKVQLAESSSSSGDKKSAASTLPNDGAVQGTIRTVNPEATSEIEVIINNLTDSDVVTVVEPPDEVVATISEPNYSGIAQRYSELSGTHVFTLQMSNPIHTSLVSSDASASPSKMIAGSTRASPTIGPITFPGKILASIFASVTIVLLILL
ncbi:hypothetical protein TRVA0_022S00738 [Trichomonascus vanleenenianus]|uniref:uncharacterized protein n=1 Tax=Trichomonascus vanleenenianus TaxID=2268995 RepID=UPI003EC9B66B